MFELINKFITCTTGETMCIVKTKNGMSVMSESEYKWAYGQYHPEKWEKKNVNKVA